jgi:hypothetical protein
LSWTASPLVSIEDVDIVTFLNYMTQVTSDFQDPDAIFNQAFFSLAFTYNPAAFGGGDLFIYGGHTYGFRTDYWTYKFANGTTTQFQNVAKTEYNFSAIQTGQDLFNLVDLPPTEVATTAASDAAAAAVASSSAPATTSAPANSTRSATSADSTSSVITSLAGYPSPLVIHPDGYTSGYFLPNSTIAVLAMQGFVDTFESDPYAAPYQQAVIEAFLNESRKAGMTKLIIDLQANGGGDIFAGFDAFKQLFPTLTPFGASRLRATPAANYMGEVFSAAGIYTDSENTIYQFQSSLDVNNHAFSNWNAEDGPVTIYGDNFTQELRYNFSDPVQEYGSGGINVTGYLTEANVAPQLFQSEDIVLVYDGSCGSTCAVFSELMKAQGGVRSIAVGGRPQVGPMQGVAGSKGAQVYTFGTIAAIATQLPAALLAMVEKGLTPPPFPPLEYVPSVFGNFPLGNSTVLASGSRFNLRNNMHDGDTTYTPLQFTYEAANCKLFYTPTDIYEITGLWERVAEVAWGTGKCVSGSSVNADDTFPANPYDTVPFAASAYSTVIQAYQPGLLAQKSAVV